MTVLAGTLSIDQLWKEKTDGYKRVRELAVALEFRNTENLVLDFTFKRLRETAFMNRSPDRINTLA